MSTAHLALSQQPCADALVELFTLNTTPIGGGAVYRWTPGPLGAVMVSYAGIVYTPCPIETDGFEWNGRGQLPVPKIRVSNVSGLAAGVVIGLGDALGATVTRLRTFVRFLDGQPGADTGASFEPDVFRVERKSSHTKNIIEWELSASIDLQGMKLPRRQAIRNTCTHTYRGWVSGAWVPGTCPYSGGGLWAADGASVGSNAQDVCGKRVSDCMLRFGSNGILYTRAFPGIAIQSYS